MLSSAASLAPWWSVLAAMAFLVTALWAASRARWRRLREPGQQHLFFGAVVTTMLLWRLNAAVLPGLDLHFIGAAALVLMFGPHLAFLALTGALAGTAALGAADLPALGLTGLLTIALPVAAVSLMTRVPGLPRHPAARAFGHGFAGGLFSILATGAAAVAVLSVSGEFGPAFLAREYLPFLCLLAWSEAVLTGVILFVFAIDRPHWLVGILTLSKGERVSDRRHHRRGGGSCPGE